ncbi:dihydroorotase [Methanococcoides orientis]|uniref:dihydroorotase n=1 Tax=Methanococcoides orientis TaxID=2822137 RepID=UPI001E40468A|nr:dihydroorotase [Methanococcoides orientis]UGV41387.1 dihydroorotase [Methanococcoides orientis]
MTDILIKNTKVFYNNFLQPGEVSINNGKIERIAKDISGADPDLLIDAKGALTIPAGIDAHVHFREPGMIKKEDWYTGSCSAAAGGITTVIEHPNTIPPTVDKSSFKEKLKLAKRKSVIDFGINGGVTQNLESLSLLWELGVTSFGEIFMAESTGGLNINEEDFAQSLEIIKDLDAVACIHAEDENIRLENEKLLKKDFSPSSHSRIRSNLCEGYAVEKALEVIAKKGTRSHFCHISTLEALGLIRKEKYVAAAENREHTVTCEVAPHHLFLSTRDWDKLGTFGKMNPPLRDRRNVKALMNAVNDGTVSAIASDHAPHSEFDKDLDIRSAPSGVPGVETLMPLMLMAVKKNILPIGRMIEVTSRNPAHIFGLDTRHSKGVFAEGYDADLIIVDTRNATPIKADKLHSKAGWSPFEGMDAIFPMTTIARGEVVWENEVIAEKGRGKFLEGHGYPEEEQ